MIRKSALTHSCRDLLLMDRVDHDQLLNYPLKQSGNGFTLKEKLSQTEIAKKILGRDKVLHIFLLDTSTRPNVSQFRGL